MDVQLLRLQSHYLGKYGVSSKDFRFNPVLLPVRTCFHPGASGRDIHYIDFDSFFAHNTGVYIFQNYHPQGGEGIGHKQQHFFHSFDAFYSKINRIFLVQKKKFLKAFELSGKIIF